jgi:DnaJ-class molecular chaperone
LGIDEQYEQWQSSQIAYNLSNWIDLIIQKIENEKEIDYNEISHLKQAINAFDIDMGFAILCPECKGEGGWNGTDGELPTMCKKCNGRGVIQNPFKNFTIYDKQTHSEIKEKE